MVKAGIVAPNRQWELWTDEEIAAIIDLRPGILQVLVYNNESDQYRAFQCWRVKLVLPDIVFQYRVYGSNIPDVQPQVWAKLVYSMLNNSSYPPGEVICANEMNLSGEGGHQDWVRHTIWLERFAAIYRDLARDGRYNALHLPAWSPVGSYRDGWAVLAQRRVHLQYDVVDVHQYGGDTSDLDFVLKLFPDKLVSVTEFNGVRPSQYFKVLNGGYPRVRDACWFILSGTEDQRQYWLMGSEHYDDFRKYTHEEVGTSMPQHKIEATLDLTPEEDAVFFAWYQAAGYAGKIIYDQFRLWYVATQSQVQPTNEDLERAIDKVSSGWTETKLMLGKLPKVV